MAHFSTESCLNLAFDLTCYFLEVLAERCFQMLLAARILTPRCVGMSSRQTTIFALDLANIPAKQLHSAKPTSRHGQWVKS